MATESEQLEKFYKPFQSNQKRSTELYKVFVKGKPECFRTLTYLIDPNQEYPGYGRVTLSQGDRALLDEIIEIGMEQYRLISEHADLISDDELVGHRSASDLKDDRADLLGTGLLAKAAAHYKLLQLAHAGKLENDPSRYAEYVFPRELPIIIEKKIDALEASQLESA